MVVIVRDRKVVFANLLDGGIFFVFSLVLFVGEDIVRVGICSGWLGLHSVHFGIHVCNIVYVLNVIISCSIIRGCLPVITIDIINYLHRTVDVHDLIFFSIDGWACFEPSITNIDLLDGAR